MSNNNHDIETLLKVAIRYFMLSSKPFSKDVKEQIELGKVEKELEKLTKVRKSNASRKRSPEKAGGDSPKHEKGRNAKKLQQRGS